MQKEKCSNRTPFCYSAYRYNISKLLKIIKKLLTFNIFGAIISVSKYLRLTKIGDDYEF